MLQNFKQHQLAPEEAQHIKGGKIITPPSSDDSTEGGSAPPKEPKVAFAIFWSD